MSIKILFNFCFSGPCLHYFSGMDRYEDFLLYVKDTLIFIITLVFHSIYYKLLMVEESGVTKTIYRYEMGEHYTATYNDISNPGTGL